MKRYIFDVAGGEPALINEDAQRTLAANYASLDPSFKYFRSIRWTLDSGDLADIRLVEQSNYKDPNSVLAKKFMSAATATAAGLAECFVHTRIRVLYVVIEVFEDAYEVAVLQDAHPRAISGSRQLAPAPRISPKLVAVALKNAVARLAGPLREELERQRAQAVAALPSSGSGLDL